MGESGKMVSEKVFPYLLSKAAFIDTILLSVWTEDKTILGKLLDENKKPILNGTSRYARLVKGRAPLTGNPVEIVYGKLSRFSNVPPCQVRMRSEEVPLTGAQVNETMRLIFPTATRIQPVLVELTFDLDRKSTRLNSSHLGISYAVFC